jgi:hypothetical protein
MRRRFLGYRPNCNAAYGQDQHSNHAS